MCRDMKNYSFSTFCGLLMALQLYWNTFLSLKI
uniref:Uncharacterized protein n=1 Tax=Anguilla anguilla TaxID=7936 RepID=A0A0E9UN47_ANGAN